MCKNGLPKMVVGARLLGRQTIKWAPGCGVPQCKISNVQNNDEWTMMNDEQWTMTNSLFMLNGVLTQFSWDQIWFWLKWHGTFLNSTHLWIMHGVPKSSSTHLFHLLCHWLLALNSTLLTQQCHLRINDWTGWSGGGGGRSVGNVVWCWTRCLIYWS